MMTETRTLCPLLRSDCREECNWRHNVTYIDDDGINSYDYCAINLIAHQLIDYNGYRKLDRDAE